MERIQYMPKMKTKKSAAKRFKLTASGRVKRFKAFATHLLKNKSSKSKRKTRKAEMLTAADESRIKTLLQ